MSVPITPMPSSMPRSLVPPLGRKEVSHVFRIDCRYSDYPRAIYLSGIRYIAYKLTRFPCPNHYRHPRLRPDSDYCNDIFCCISVRKNSAGSAKPSCLTTDRPSHPRASICFRVRLLLLVQWVPLPV